MPQTRKRRRENELGPGSAGQSGGIQQVPDKASADSESVEELAEEGNAYEADVVEGVEKAEKKAERKVKTEHPREDETPERR